MGRCSKRSENRIEFSLDEYQEIDSYCKLKKINWFASAWDLNSQIFLRQFDTKYNKIASAMIVDLKFLSLSQKKERYISLQGCLALKILKMLLIFSRKVIVPLN